MTLMRHSPRQNGLVVWAPAKVNLFLEILGKRADGYHEIETLMVRLSLHDTLRLVDDPSGAVRLRCDLPGLSVGPDNLVLRAARLLKEQTTCERGALIGLRKRVPMMAGLAGGSSDAAATLKGLNRLWELNRTDEELASLSAELGSDIPFFFSTPAALCTGRGEKVRPVATATRIDLVLVCPPFGCGTADVYRKVSLTGQSEASDPIVAELEKGDVVGVASRLHNRLEAAAFQVAPALTDWMRAARGTPSAGRLHERQRQHAVCRVP